MGDPAAVATSLPSNRALPVDKKTKTVMHLSVVYPTIPPRAVGREGWKI